MLASECRPHWFFHEGGKSEHTTRCVIPGFRGHEIVEESPCRGEGWNSGNGAGCCCVDEDQKSKVESLRDFCRDNSWVAWFGRRPVGIWNLAVFVGMDIGMLIG